MVRQQSSNGETILAVAAMDKKLRSTAMQRLLREVERRAARARVRVLVLSEGLMRTCPVHQWPVAHVLLTLYSIGFPLDKVLRYVALRSPLLVNNIHMQPLMMDRRSIRRVLSAAGVPTPPAVYCDRSTHGDYTTQSGAFGNTLVVHSPSRATSYTIEKPFVEKPVDPEDHNVYIYYRDGGMRKLFRKLNNVSSSYDDGPASWYVRSNGDFIYEQFFAPAAESDVKVYAVGRGFVHAEARKAPHVDGIVERDVLGRERRTVTALNSEERAICNRVVDAFDQFIVGFDLLRCTAGGESEEQHEEQKQFVIDVNGMSLVKNSRDYSKHCARQLLTHVHRCLDERRALHIRALHLARPHHHNTFLNHLTDKIVAYNDSRQCDQTASTTKAATSTPKSTLACTALDRHDIGNVEILAQPAQQLQQRHDSHILRGLINIDV